MNKKQLDMLAVILLIAIIIGLIANMVLDGHTLKSKECSVAVTYTNGDIEILTFETYDVNKLSLNKGDLGAPVNKNSYAGNYRVFVSDVRRYEIIKCNE
ncbi:hypothetical protein Molly5_156 [Maribacter phage Molly_5]|uniref:Uncharacterized protein n=1 Tax=Maribacter phage Molly_1 TaxID=2745685 RepID=A0A8E4UY72_9CAUD|nr:hypothetical protein M1M29_gp156 [Maribacter phage Molly_1]QQO97651.1 hypothetical protein Molly2_156 [Maribacter phage Molly_2]QQO97851.1 hypothetical protein Molly3_156 [Maribacter phage Molly_3]QQO98051.1 hypothetical protein Molly4_156 [Maribacter phage Molly_4]QQO98251.1 hypothetical protein Molly5_156 [Maribacter phage Molly_5]QQO97451.1 hypothetical protein Molly1_156 [Maribacter phage Molly_1]